jgi:hypothetical protein
MPELFVAQSPEVNRAARLHHRRLRVLRDYVYFMLAFYSVSRLPCKSEVDSMFAVTCIG